MVKVAPNSARLAKQWSTRKEPATRRKRARERKAKIDKVLRDTGGKFKEGPGRPAGVPNKITRIMKDALVLAAEAVGSDGAGADGLVGYLENVARTEKEVFCGLLSKLLPIQFNSRTDATMNLNVTTRPPQEILNEMMQRGLKLNGQPLELIALPEFNTDPNKIEAIEQVNGTGTDS